MFKYMEIVKSIYEGVVVHSYKKLTMIDANRDGYSRQIRGEADSSKNYSEISNISGKHKQMCVDHPRY